MGQIIGGLTQVAGSMVGGRARRREQKAANREFQTDRANFRDFQLTNQFADMENVYEDLTVNTQAAEFQAQQTDAALAQGLDAIVAGGGGGGGAQAIAAAALQSKQGISASIAQQEQQNQAMQAKAAETLQFQDATARDDLQLRQYDRSQQLLNMSAQRKQKADDARAQATSALIGGIGNVVGGVASAMTGGIGGAAGTLGGAIDKGIVGGAGKLLGGGGPAGGQSRLGFAANAIASGNGIPKSGSYEAYKNISGNIGKPGYNLLQGF